jgi:Flp pilus assembly protein TadB
MGTGEANDKYSGALEVDLARSRFVPALIAIALAATCGVLAFTPLAPGYAILLATWVACTGIHALGRALRAHRLSIGRGGEVAVDGIAGNLRAGSFVAPWLAIVRWRPAGSRLDRTLLVAPDMLGEGAFRELRVILKTGALPE